MDDISSRLMFHSTAMTEPQHTDVEERRPKNGRRALLVAVSGLLLALAFCIFLTGDAATNTETLLPISEKKKIGPSCRLGVLLSTLTCMRRHGGVYVKRHTHIYAHMHVLLLY